MVENGQPLRSKSLNKLYAKYQIKGSHFSQPHMPTNGLPEAFNKTLARSLRQLWTKNKVGLTDCLRPYEFKEPRSDPNPTLIFSCLWRGSGIATRNTDFIIEVGGAWWMISERKANLHFVELATERLVGHQNLELYRQQMLNALNKRVWLRTSQKGDLFLVRRAPMIISREKGNSKRIGGRGVLS